MALHEFIQIYESKTDDELLLIARDFEQLTVEAQGALRSELSRRGLTNVELPEPARAQVLRSRLPRPMIQTAEFLSHVTRLYRDHFWLFMKLISPAVILGYIATQMIRPQVVRSLLQSYSEGSTSRGGFLLEVSIVSQLAYFTSWMVGCIAFAGICSAVARVSEGLSPKFSECFQELSDRKWKFSKIAMLLYLVFGAGSAFGGLIVAGLWTLVPSMMRAGDSQLIGYALYVIVALLTTRLSLAIPAVILDNKGVRNSIFLSDELTAGKWTILFALLCKSVVGGYIAGMIPFWAANWTGAHVNPWLLTVASGAAVSVVEPLMFIGFSLLYVNGTAEPVTAAASVFATQSDR